MKDLLGFVRRKSSLSVYEGMKSTSGLSASAVDANNDEIKSSENTKTNSGPFIYIIINYIFTAGIKRFEPTGKYLNTYIKYLIVVIYGL